MKDYSKKVRGVNQGESINRVELCKSEIRKDVSKTGSG